jgi:Helix-turn-helix domain
VSGVSDTLAWVAESVVAGVRLSGLSFRLDPTDAQAGLLARAAGARRKASNEAVARVRDNRAEWAAQRAAGVPAEERVRPPSAIDLRAAWKTDRPVWHREVSSWVFDWTPRNRDDFSCRASQRHQRGEPRQTFVCSCRAASASEPEIEG